MRPVVLRNAVAVEKPLGVVLGYIEAWHLEVNEPSRPISFAGPDLRLANRGGARISAEEIGAILKRRRTIERALRTIAPDATLATTSVPWMPLRGLFDAFADIRGVGFSKMTKALHPKRPALVPLLDSVVQRYLESDDPGGEAPFAERALALVRGYKRDLDRNRATRFRPPRRAGRRRGPLALDCQSLDCPENDAVPEAGRTRDLVLAHATNQLPEYCVSEQ